MDPTPKDTFDDMDNKYSIGTAVVVSNLLAMLSAPTAVKCDIILLNVATVLRNSYEKDIRMKDWVKTTESQVQDMISELSDAFNNGPAVKPVIIPYLAHYNKTLPPESRKNMTTRRMLRDSAISQLLTNRHLFRTYMNGKVQVIATPMRGKQQSSVLLLQQIHNIKNLRKILMISHVALDFHIFKYMKDSLILESFTGNHFKPSPKTLASKVFGRDDIPFFPATHAMLGDKDIVQAPFESRVDKAKFLALSEPNHWKLATESKIINDIKKNEFKIPFKVF